MHIPDGFLDPKVSSGLAAVAAMAFAFCFSKVKAAVTAAVPQQALAAVGKGVTNITGKARTALTKQGESFIYKMGMVASLVFAAQMFNFPINQGTSGHLIGGVLAAVILGPFAGTIVIAVVLLVQSLFFADGGVISIGANIINMAVIGSLISYYIYFFIKKFSPQWLAIFVAAWASVVLASLACAVEVGFSGTVPMPVIIRSMLSVHVLIGIAEGLITLVLINVFKLLLKDEEK